MKFQITYDNLGQFRLRSLPQGTTVHQESQGSVHEKFGYVPFTAHKQELVFDSSGLPMAIVYAQAISNEHSQILG